LPRDAAHCDANGGAQETPRLPPALCFETTLRALAFPRNLAQARALDRSSRKERLSIVTILRAQLRVLSDALGASQRPLGIAGSISGSAPSQRTGIPRPLPLPVLWTVQPGLIRACGATIGAWPIDVLAPALMLDRRRAWKRSEAGF
jgi:hypothetical protein